MWCDWTNVSSADILNSVYIIQKTTFKETLMKQCLVQCLVDAVGLGCEFLLLC